MASLKGLSEEEQAALRHKRHLYYLANQEKIKAKSRVYEKKNEVKVRRYRKLYRIKNKEKFTAYQRKRYLDNINEIRAANREYHWKNRARLLPMMRKLYRKNRKQRLEKQNAYYKKNSDQVKAYQKIYAKKFPEKIKTRSKAYRKKNILKIKAIDRKRSKLRYRDPEFRRKMDAYRIKNLPKTRAKLAARIVSLKELYFNCCGKCGYRKNPEILDFDHIVPLRRGRVRTWKDRYGGILDHRDRYQLLCHNCHAIKSSLENQGSQWTKSSEQYWKKRMALLMEFDSQCVSCGYGENILALEFDHIDGMDGQERQPSIVCVPKAPHLFQLLCSNCHALKTLAENKERSARRRGEDVRGS